MRREIEIRYFIMVIQIYIEKGNVNCVNCTIITPNKIFTERSLGASSLVGN